jgi:hypothetical protein
MLQYLGLGLVLASWVGGFFLVSKWYNKNLATISKHAASDKKALRVFAGILIGLGSAFYYWLLVWFIPELHLGRLFQCVLAATIICQIITALAPDTIGWRKKIHYIAAYTMAALYLPLSLLILSSSEVSMLARIIGIGLVIYMVTSFVLVAMLGKVRTRYLLFQASYIVAFQLVIVIAAYL